MSSGFERSTGFQRTVLKMMEDRLVPKFSPNGSSHFKQIERADLMDLVLEQLAVETGNRPFCRMCGMDLIGLAEEKLGQVVEICVLRIIDPERTPGMTTVAQIGFCEPICQEVWLATNLKETS